LSAEYGEQILVEVGRASSLRAQLTAWLTVTQEQRGVVRALHELARVGSPDAESRHVLRDQVAELLMPKLAAATGLDDVEDVRPATLMVCDIVAQYALMEAAGWVPERDPAAVAKELERLVKRGLYRR
jgi:hypothetical protein